MLSDEAFTRRVEPKIEPDTAGGCWLWSGSTTPHGYGSIRSGGRGSPDVYVHRLMFERYHRPLEKGEVVMHKCDVPQCCNPEHLQAGTFEENMADMVRKDRSPRGMRSGRRKIDETAVRAIRADRRTLVPIAEEFGISINQVSRIKRRIDWSHVA